MDFSDSAAAGRVVCVVEAYNARETLGDVLYGEMLGIIARAWNKQQSSLRREIIGGMSSFMKKYSGEYCPERLEKCLSKVSPIQIIRDGNLASESSTAKYAEQIVKVYNKGTKKKLL